MSQRYLGGIITANPTAPTLTSASGVWTTEQQFQNIANWPKSTGLVSRSVRLRSSASASFNRTFTTGNTKTWTWSGWVKRGSLSGTQQFIFNHTASQSYIQFNTSENITVGFYSTNSATGYILTTSQVFRDPSAWYHVVWAVDTTQATNTNRIKLYVNGVQVTAFSSATYPAQNDVGQINTAAVHRIASYDGSILSFDGYLTEINFIDGQALTPSYFGFTDGNGVWQPATYSGTYGTNGFYLNFSDNSGVTATTIGKDYSGNGNNWTPNNISVTAGVTYDSMLDVPTPYADGGNGRGNYCTLNPLENPYGFTLSGGNLDMSGANAWRGTRATIGVTSGKWYWEYIHTSATAGGGTGISTQAGYTWAQMAANDMGVYSGGWEYIYTGQKGNNNSFVSYGAAFTQNDVIGVAFDADTGTLTFYKNGVSQGTAYTGLTSGPYFPTDAGAFGGNNYNFGQRPFSYTPPTGFVALNTQNLPTPTISNGASYMAATTYTGTGASLTVANTVGSASFQPDLVWVKGRSGATDHAWYDAVRGVQKQLESNTTTAETTETTGLTAFGSTGFTVGALAQMNTNTATYVAWQWNAGGSTVTNTSGTISSQVRANATAGFSVVTYTGNGLTNQSVGHGLNATPGMVIIKQRDGTANWLVHHQSQPTGYTLYLNLTNAQDSGTSQWGTSAQTSSLFYVGYTAGATGSNVNASTYVAYCFAPVAGYSAFGSYIGNGSADGPFVYLGFRPRWLMIKRSSSASVTYGWQMYDTSRQPVNTASSDPNLWADTSAAEGTGNYTFDLLSNGFKLRSSGVNENASGDTYIYAAFAENPFKLSRAR